MSFVLTNGPPDEWFSSEQLAWSEYGISRYLLNAALKRMCREGVLQRDLVRRVNLRFARVKWKLKQQG